MYTKVCDYFLDFVDEIFSICDNNHLATFRDVCVVHTQEGTREKYHPKRRSYLRIRIKPVVDYSGLMGYRAMLLA